MQKRKTPAIEDPVKPASTAELRREGRLARIAKALISGATVTEIAEAEGIGRTLASRQANPPIIQRASGGQVSAFSGSPTHRAQYREAARTGRDGPSNCAAHLD